ncbi:tripartite tricarboxylate transporter substrate-binding protein [Pigmentiphaga litoralis]|uniref:tripartite tricarboxylate transporter substrate-binding protein n=1 Tax=Pigmentiphaga litoralis TaxID=516702 RepID=UPI003B438AEE
MWAYHPQLPEVIELAKAFPETTIVLNHAGGPLNLGPYRHDRPRVLAAWRRSLDTLAQLPNVSIKLGGLCMVIGGLDLHLRPVPPGSEELADLLRPLLLPCMDAFGHDRCMFESNFSMDKGMCAYGVLWNAFKRIAADCDGTQKTELFRERQPERIALNFDVPQWRRHDDNPIERLAGCVAGVVAGRWLNDQPICPGRGCRLPESACQAGGRRPPGGAPDTVGRIIAQYMKLGQAVVVENKNGAASAIATELVARAPADGYTLLLTSQTGIAVSPIINKIKSFDPQKDFIGVGLIGSAPLVLVAGPSLPAKTVPEIIALAKSKPGVLDYGNGGIGTSPFMAGALFSVMTGTQITSIPFPGEQAAMTEIMAGRLPMMFANASSAMPHVRSGRLRGLAVTSPTRVSVAEGLPTMSESGVPGFDIGTWLGVVAPAGTPQDVVARLHAELSRVLAVPEVREKLTAQGFVLADMSVAQFNQHIKSEYAKWSRLIQDAGIKAQ